MQSIPKNEMKDIDSLKLVMESGVKMRTGLAMMNSDDDLRNGTHESRRLHHHRKKHHGDEHLTPIFYPAGKPLTTDREIMTWRNKQIGTYKLDNWLFIDFRNAHRYAQGKPAKTLQGYTIQQGKHPSKN